MKLPVDFFLRTDVVQIARELLGKKLITVIGGARTAVRITETEAYRAPDDRASHAYSNRFTPRTRTMFLSGGRGYIYLNYGIHHLFNVVTAPEGMAHAVLIRAGEPLEGLEVMVQRRGGVPATDTRLTTGPGVLGQALGLTTAMDNCLFHADSAPYWIEYDESSPIFSIEAGPRIGVEYAGPCALWPWRFWMAGSAYVKTTGKKKL